MFDALRISKTQITLFSIVFLVHLAAALFIHFAQFYPFGEGQVIQMHPFTVRLLSVFITACSAVFVFILALEVGAGKRGAFVVGLILGLYPSYLYYGSLLMREAAVVSLSLLALLAMVRLMKRFSWIQFLVFSVVVAALLYVRFYVGFVTLFTFLLLIPFFLHAMHRSQRMTYGLVIVLLLGLVPQVLGQGYFGANIIPNYLKPAVVQYYPEVAYFSVPELFSDKPFDIPLKDSVAPGTLTTFAGNYIISSAFVAFGPFPWQITHVRQLFVLVETLPWYVLLFFIGKGMVRTRSQWKLFLPIILFSAGVLGVMALFIDNFGVYSRVRMPAFIAMVSLAPLAFWHAKEATRSLTLAHTYNYKVCQVATVDISFRFLLLRQIQYLKGLGFRVIGLSSKGKWVGEVEKQGIPMKTIEITRRLFTPLRDLAALRRMIFFFARERFDIVHTHTLKASFLGQLAALIVGVPIRVYTIHGLFFQRNSSWFKRQFFILIERISAGSAHLVFFDNREDIETVRQHRICDPKKLRYLGGGIDMERFDPNIFSREFIWHKKRELGIPSEARVVGIVSRLVKEKGYLELFEAFREVIRKFPETILLVVGPEEPVKQDKFHPSLVKKYGIGSSVFFLGEQTDVVQLYAVMDILVLPSHREGLGLVILEASAMEKPVIASDIRGCQEAVDNNRTGLLVPVKNPPKLAEAITYLLSHPERAREMGLAGRKKVEREFSEEIVFERMRREYERLIQEKLR